MKNKKNITFNNKQTLFFNIFISVSMFFLTLIFSNYIDQLTKPIPIIYINSFLSVFILLIILLKNNKIISLNKKRIILSSLISAYCINIFLDFNINKLLLITGKSSITILIFLIGVFALPAFSLFIYLFIDRIFPKIKKFFISLDTTERRYLTIIFIVAIVFSTIICFKTKAFTTPTFEIYSISDIIYTSDSGILTSNDAFVNFSHVENDIRQPLFGVFASPFSMIARFFSNFFFVKNGQAYWTIMMIIQFLLNAITTIMLSRLLKLDNKYKKYFYLLFSISFPYLIFSIVLEQYSIALFYLILSIYIWFNSKKINYSYIGAVGTLLTSGIIFPLITKFKSIKQWIKDVFKCFIAFIITVIFTGQLSQMLNLGNEIASFKQFSGNTMFVDRIFRFSNFVKSIFLGTEGYIGGYPINGSTVPSYTLKMPTTINYIGVIIFVLLLISFVVNRKNKMAILSFLWMLFSIVILVIVGWGQPENGLILYSLYFSWAYLILYFLLIKKIFKKEKIFKIVIILSIMIMAIFNFKELFNIISFAIKYY